MSVTNGQAADQTTFNNAFASKQSDNTLDGIQSLEHPTSGGNIANLQQTVNDNTDNIATNTADIATQGTDISNLQNDVTDLELETTDLRTLTGTSAPAVDLGTFTGSVITDNSTVKAALQELENEVELKIDSTEKGAAGGVAPLDGTSKIDVSYLPTSIVGSLNYQGTWNASTNTPSLSSGVGTKGYYYVISVAGSTSLDGISSWAIGDWAVYNGTAWEKIDNTDVVTSVNSQTGPVILDTDDVSEGATNLYYTDVRVAANSAVAANTAKVSADGSINTHSDVDTATNPPALNDSLVWDGSNWVPGEGGSGSGVGGINYITNFDAEVDTAGWATYADAAGVIPVDGNSGTSVVTFTRTTSSPLRGTGSFLFTKDAANRQGEGASYDFTIDSADQAKVLSVSFDYIVSSGTFVAGSNNSDSDVICYLFDVTNSRLIEPSTKKLFSNSSTVSDKYESSFQTSSDSVSYRLILHVASTSAIAYALKIDNVLVGPSEYVFGTPISDWVSFTPTGSLTTNSTYSGFWRRVGDSMEVETNLNFSGSNTQGAATINLPAGYSIDTAKINNTATDGSKILGEGVLLDAATNNYPVFVKYLSATSLSIRAINSGGTYGVDNEVNTSTNVPITIANGDKINLKFKVPILGFSSSVQVSDRADTRVTVANVNFAATAQSGSFATLDISGNTNDTHGAVDATNNYYVIPSQGFYTIGLSVEWASDTYATGDQLYIGYSIDGGSDVVVAQKSLPVNTQIQYLSGVSRPVSLNAGQLVRWRSANTTATAPSTNTNTVGWIQKVQGPSSISATEEISLTYVNNGGQVLTANVTNITWSTKVFDSHSAWDGTTFTAPASGRYQISMCVNTSASVQNGFEIYKNGTQHLRIGSDGGAVTVHVGSSPIVNLNSGDTITIRAVVGATLASNAVLHWVSIERVK